MWYGYLLSPKCHQVGPGQNDKPGLMTNINQNPHPKHTAVKPYTWNDLKCPQNVYKDDTIYNMQSKPKEEKLTSNQRQVKVHILKSIKLWIKRQKTNRNQINTLGSQHYHRWCSLYHRVDFECTHADGRRWHTQTLEVMQHHLDRGQNMKCTQEMGGAYQHIIIQLT